jgi:hypothetical protein
MDGRAYLDVARDLAAGSTEAHWRTAAGRVYYAVLHEGLTALLRWGFTIPPRENLHAFVRLGFVFAIDPDLKTVGRALEYLSKLRNQADYQLANLGPFATGTRVAQALADAAIARLDQIDGDPTRRAAAIATIRP